MAGFRAGLHASKTVTQRLTVFCFYTGDIRETIMWFLFLSGYTRVEAFHDHLHATELLIGHTAC